jgi:hypothetical protein
MKAQEWGSLLLLSDVSPRLCCCIGLNDEWRDRSCMIHLFYASLSYDVPALCVTVLLGLICFHAYDNLPSA